MNDAHAATLRARRNAYEAKKRRAFVRLVAEWNKFRARYEHEHPPPGRDDELGYDIWLTWCIHAWQKVELSYAGSIAAAMHFFWKDPPSIHGEV